MYQLVYQVVGGLLGRWYDQSVNYLYANSRLVVAPNGHPIYMIGGWEFSAETPEDSLTQSEAFRAQLDTLPWLTYRSGFAPLTGGLTSDSGWGCTVRSSQMLIAAAMVHSELGKEFKRDITATPEANTTYAKIVSLFADDVAAPMGLHRIMEYSLENNIVSRAGQWFGPHAATSVLTNRRNSASPSLDHIGLFFGLDGVISRRYVQKALDRFPRGVLLILSARLTAEMCIDTHRAKAPILELFKVPSFRGIVGGDGVSQSYFFPAASEDYLYILDPHTTQPAVPPSLEASDLNRFVSPQPGVMAMRWPRLGSSMAFAFLVPSQAALTQLETELATLSKSLGFGFAK